MTSKAKALEALENCDRIGPRGYLENHINDQALLNQQLTDTLTKFELAATQHVKVTPALLQEAREVLLMAAMQD